MVEGFTRLECVIRGSIYPTVQLWRLTTGVRVVPVDLVAETKEVFTFGRRSICIEKATAAAFPPSQFNQTRGQACPAEFPGFSLVVCQRHCSTTSRIMAFQFPIVLTLSFSGHLARLSRAQHDEMQFFHHSMEDLSSFYGTHVLPRWTTEDKLHTAV